MNSNKGHDLAKNGFFDSIEIKGLSAKSARAFSAGRLSRLIRFIAKLLVHTPARVYGFASLSFGLLTLFLHLGEYYFRDNPEVKASSLIIGAVFTLISAFLLISDKPIAIALQSSRLTDFIVFEFFSISRTHSSDDESRLPSIAGVVFGFLLALLGFFTPTEYAALLVIALIFLAASLVSPEFPHIFALLVFPYLSLIPYSEWVLLSMVVLMLFSYARKVLVGKRVYALEIYDILLILLILSVLLIGAAFGEGAATLKSAFAAVFILSYIPAANIAVNRRLCDCLTSAIAVSSIPVSLYSIVRYAVKFFLDEREASYAWFSSPRILAVFLSVVFVFTAYLSVQRSNKHKKNYYALVSVLAFLAILTTEYFIVPVVILTGIVAFLIIRSKKISKLLLIPLIAAPYLVAVIPSAILGKISETLNLPVDIYDEMLSYRNSIKLFLDNVFFGIGDEAFLSSGQPTGNTLLGIVLRFGITALLILLILMVIRVIHIGVCKKYFAESVVGFYVEMTTLATFLMLMLGSFTDIFSDVVSVYFFVAVFAMGSSALRISKKERDQRLSYYKDSRRVESAVIDVNIRG